jgi:hemerythrin-like domain-containing protein
MSQATAIRTPARCDTSDMVIIHRVFRREFRLLPAMVRAVDDGDTARSARIADHAGELITALHHHHCGEDELLWPLLRARAALDGDLIDRMQHQHDELAAALDAAEPLLPRWARTAAPAARDPLAVALTSVSASLDEHLADEEAELLPLAAQHVSEVEWARLGQRGMASVPRDRMLVFLGHVLAGTSDAERAQFLARVPMLGRVAFRLVGRRRYRAEVRALRGGLGAD